MLTHLVPPEAAMTSAFTVRTTGSKTSRPRNISFWVHLYQTFSAITLHPSLARSQIERPLPQERRRSVQSA